MSTARVAVVLATLVLGLTAGAAAAPDGPVPPVLRLAAAAPLAIEGRGFVGGERVQVVAITAAEQQTRTTVASPKGRLRIRFTFGVGRCAELTVRATGVFGSRAVLRREGECRKPTKPPAGGGKPRKP